LSTAAYRRIGALEVAGATGVVLGLVVPLLGYVAGAGLLVLLAGANARFLAERTRIRTTREPDPAAGRTFGRQ
jgi:hypothetical protein